MRVALLVAVFLTSQFGIPTTAEAAQDCTLKEFTSVDFRVDEDGAVIVPVTIGDQPAFMKLITESTLAIAGSFVKDNHIRTKLISEWARTDMQNNYNGVASLRDFTNVADIRESAIPSSFRIGSLPLQAAFIVDPKRTVSSPEEPIGSFGITLFSGVDFELDFGQHKLSVYSQDHCPGQVVYWSNSYSSIPLRSDGNGQMFFPMEIEGKKIETIVGTATPMTSLHNRASKMLFGYDGSAPEANSNPQAPASASQFMKLGTNGVTVINAWVHFDDFGGCNNAELVKQQGEDKAMGYRRNGSGMWGCPSGFTLGMNVLQKLRLYFAMKEKVLYFTAADATK